MAKKIAILVMDDDDGLLEFMRAALVDAGYDVRTASDGEQGLESLKGSKPDLAIVDLIMPRMHGFDVLEKIQQDPSLKGMRVLVASAKGYAVDHKAAERLGAERFLQKPFTVDQLLEAVKELSE